MKAYKHLIYLCIAVLLAACSSSKKDKSETTMVGNDRDSHNCIASAGYTWSEVRKDCVRLFEVGVRLEATGDKQESAFLVFSPDSLKVELFLSDGSTPEILDRHALPDGSYAWNIEDDDTKNIGKTNGLWSITQRGKILYEQKASQQETFAYEGILPAADCPGIRYHLTIKAPKHSGDGTFKLIQTYMEANNGKDQTFTTTGKRYTLRGDATNKDATVWQLIPENGNTPINFLVEDGGEKLTLLNSELEKSNSGLNYSLRLIK